MRILFYCILFLFFVCYVWIKTDLIQKVRNLLEPTEIYFTASEWYENESDELIIIQLRSSNTFFSVPRNRLINVSHTYQPWAEEVWDSFAYHVFWPKFEGRNKKNISEFKNNYSDKIIHVNVSDYSAESNIKDYSHPIHNSFAYAKKILTTEQPIKYLQRYVLATGTNPNRVNYFYQVDIHYKLAPSGLPLQIECKKALSNKIKRTECIIEFVLPSKAWPKESYGGNNMQNECHRGIGIKIYFHENLLHEWETIFDRVLNDMLEQIVLSKIEYTHQKKTLNFGCW
ncbi:hypothetical protein AAEU29_12040 [Pseudoalteromonas sp. SSM20]|uniref:hypothetical protein n=1 Tax=Pseudoalteromonas sp. SSM20 TaxID=3139394 RepID=UPI003BAC642C